MSHPSPRNGRHQDNKHPPKTSKSPQKAMAMALAQVATFPAQSPSLPSSPVPIPAAHEDEEDAEHQPSQAFSVPNGNLSLGLKVQPQSSEEQESVSEDVETTVAALPDSVLENLFSFLELKDVLAVALTCSTWQRVVSDENSEVWRTHCLKKMDRDTLNSELLETCPTFKAKLRAYYHAWNPLDLSRNIYVKPNGFTIHRNPVAQSTDGARGKKGFSQGRHAWEVKWEGPLGTVAVVGVATHDAELRAAGYIALLGRDERSWGWNLVENLLLHNGESHGNYPLDNNAPRYQVGERIRVILDCEDNTLSFEKNEEFLGVAFRGLPQHEPLYPSVSAVYGNSEISMVYLGPPLDG